MHLTRSTILDGYVGCNFLFHMAALKNDTASYVLQVFPTGAPSFPIRRAFHLPFTLDLSAPARVLLNPAARSFLCSVFHPANSTCPSPTSLSPSCACVHTLALCTHSLSLKCRHVLLLIQRHSKHSTRAPRRLDLVQHRGHRRHPGLHIQLDARGGARGQMANMFCHAGVRTCLHLCVCVCVCVCVFV